MELFDGHCDTLMRCSKTGDGLWKNRGHLDLSRTQKFDRYAQFFAIFGEAGLPEDEPLRSTFWRQYRFFQREMEQNNSRVLHCRTGREAEQAFFSGRAAAFLSVEGAELLGCNLAGLEEAWRLGVRAVNLTWNHANPLSGTNAEEQDRGLSPLGKAFATRMQELGMIIDVSHLSDPGFWDVIELAQKPVFASHSNSRSVFFERRNLTDQQFAAIMDSGGVVGLNLYADFLGRPADLDTVLAHLEHFLALGGARAVALGGDWDGCPQLVGGISGIQEIDRLWERLLQRNYREDLIRDFFYTNMMRVVSEVCTM